VTQRRALGILLAAAFAVRVLYCWGASPFNPGDPVLDISLYQMFAHSFMEHGAMLKDGLPSAGREPLYSAFLAALYTVFGASYTVVWLAHAVLGTLTVWLMFVLADKVFGRNAAWGAALMASFYPQFIYYTAQPEREIFQVHLLLCAVAALIAACREPALKKFAGAAALWAACSLTNSTLLPAGLLAALGVWLLGRSYKKDLRVPAAVFLAVYIGLYALWPIRNYMIFGRFVPGVTAGGAHLYVSLIVPNDVAGTRGEADIIANDPVMTAANHLAEEERDRYFYSASARYIAERPLRYVGVMFGSLIKLWRFYPYERDYGMNYRVIKWVGILSDGWVIPLGLVGLLLAGRRFPETDVFNLLLFATTFTYMVFWAIIRYRLPMMPFVLIYAAYALERIVEKARPGILPFPISESTR